MQISCIASVYTLYNERADRYIDEERPTVVSASASQSFIDSPSSHYSSYHDSHDSVNNHNDAQIQGKYGKLLALASSFHSHNEIAIKSLRRWKKDEFVSETLWCRKESMEWKHMQIYDIVQTVLMLSRFFFISQQLLVVIASEKKHSEIYSTSPRNRHFYDVAFIIV